MKLYNLIEELNNKERVTISETEILKGNFIGEKRIVLNRKNDSVVLSESTFNFYKYKNLIGKEVLAEIKPTKFEDLIVKEGTLKQVRAYLEEII